MNNKIHTLPDISRRKFITSSIGLIAAGLAAGLPTPLLYESNEQYLLSKKPVNICDSTLILPCNSGFSDNDEVVLTMSIYTGASLALYTHDHFVQIREKLMHLYDAKPKSKTIRGITRLVVGHAEDSIVEDGKIFISPSLMHEAGLDCDAIWIKREHQIEIRSLEFDRLEEAKKDAS